MMVLSMYPIFMVGLGLALPSAIFENYQIILYFLSPHVSLISNCFTYYSLISIKTGHYSLINKPHPDPRACVGHSGMLNCLRSSVFALTVLLAFTLQVHK